MSARAAAVRGDPWPLLLGPFWWQSRGKPQEMYFPWAGELGSFWAGGRMGKGVWEVGEGCEQSPGELLPTLRSLWALGGVTLWW